MSKFIATEVTNIGGNPVSAAATINANLETLETAIENTLSRDGTAPNAMNAALDMNSNRIYNLPAPGTNTEPLRLQDVEDLSGDVIITNQNASAIPFTPAGTVSSTNVQAAIQELDGDISGKVSTSRTITAGAGLTGGGDLSADRTLDVGAGTGITVNANDVQLAATSVYTYLMNNTNSSAAPTGVRPTVDLTAKTTLADNDVFVISDSAASNAFKKVNASVIRPRSFIFGTGLAGQVATNATGFLGPSGLSATESDACVLFPVAGTVKNLFVRGNNPGAAAQTATYTFRVDLTTDTALTAQLTNGTNVASDLTHSVSVVAGQVWSIKVVTSATCAAQDPPQFTMEFDPS